MKRAIYALVFAAGFAGTALQAWAQAPGHGMHDPLAMLQRIQAKLNLNTSQQLQWDAALTQSKASHQAMRANFQRLKAATEVELSKAEPNLAALAALSDQIHEDNIAQRKLARTAWLTLYGNLGPEQKATVRDAMKEKMARMESFRERMREHHHGS